MWRSVLAVLGGVAVSLIIVTGADALVASLHPPPPGTDPSSASGQHHAIGAMPLAAFVLLLSGWALAAGMGSFVASRVARRAPDLHGFTVGGILLVATVANLIAVRHPVWMWPAALILLPAASWAATRGLASRTATT
jgi:hypothetical protein